MIISLLIKGSELLKLIVDYRSIKIFLKWLESLEFLTSKANMFLTAVRRFHQAFVVNFSKVG